LPFQKCAKFPFCAISVTRNRFPVSIVPYKVAYPAYLNNKNKIKAARHQTKKIREANKTNKASKHCRPTTPRKLHLLSGCGPQFLSLPPPFHTNSSEGAPLFTLSSTRSTAHAAIYWKACTQFVFVFLFFASSNTKLLFVAWLVRSLYLAFSSLPRSHSLSICPASSHYLSTTEVNKISA